MLRETMAAVLLALAIAPAAVAQESTVAGINDFWNKPDMSKEASERPTSAADFLSELARAAPSPPRTAG